MRISWQVTQQLGVSRSCPGPRVFWTFICRKVLRRSRMKLISALWLAMWLTPVAGQDSAIHKVNQVMTFSYPMDSSGIMYLSSTTLPRGTEGRVAVVRGSVAISIDVQVDHIPPAQNLGANSSSYVVWLISPDGEIRNVGELRLNGDTGMLQTTTNWGAFGIFVTAEPDNCVTCPGTVVLASEVCVSGLSPVRLASIVCPKAPSQCSTSGTPLPGETQ